MERGEKFFDLQTGKLKLYHFQSNSEKKLLTNVNLTMMSQRSEFGSRTCKDPHSLLKNCALLFIRSKPLLPLLEGQISAFSEHLTITKGIHLPSDSARWYDCPCFTVGKLRHCNLGSVAQRVSELCESRCIQTLPPQHSIQSTREAIAGYLVAPLLLGWVISWLLMVMISSSTSPTVPCCCHFSASKEEDWGTFLEICC